MINDGEQFIIVFHVDDLKLSHNDVEQVSNNIPKLESTYATSIDSTTVHRGKLYHYLGMTVDFRVQEEVQLMMYDYINKLIDSLPDDMKESKHTAALEYIFCIDSEEEIKLLPERSDLFHKVAAQVLCISNYGRPDL